MKRNFKLTNCILYVRSHIAWSVSTNIIHPDNDIDHYHLEIFDKGSGMCREIILEMANVIEILDQIDIEDIKQYVKIRNKKREGNNGNI